MAGLLLAVLLYQPIYQKMYALTDLSLKTELPDAKNLSRTTGFNEQREQVITTVSTRVFSDGTQWVETKKMIESHAGGNGETKSEVVLAGKNYWWMVGLVFIQVVLVTMVYGPIAAFLVELFPTRIRYTSMSLPYHIGNGIFGGLTPFIATALYEASKTEANPTGNPFAGLWYPMIVAALCLVVGMIFLRNKTKAEVNE
jgi:MHS family proline/betaine transporter-like MFS transporter